MPARPQRRAGPAPALSPRRRQLLDAALRVIGEEGLRGLTHRAVDRRAGLPEGTCSAYLRTRRALHTALAEYVASVLEADLDVLGERLDVAPTGRAAGPEAVRDLLLRWLQHPELAVARLELTMAATRDPELAWVLAGHRARLVKLTAAATAREGAVPEPGRAEALVAAFDGILLAALLRPARSRKTYLTRSVGILTGTTADSPG